MTVELNIKGYKEFELIDGSSYEVKVEVWEYKDGVFYGAMEQVVNGKLKLIKRNWKRIPFISDVTDNEENYRQLINSGALRKNFNINNYINKNNVENF